MNKLEEFAKWMQTNTVLANSSIYKYSHAVGSISNDMLDENIISKSLYAMNAIELDISIANIIHTPSFSSKNKTGNNMYSNALKNYRYFTYNTVDNTETETNIIENINRDSTLTVTERKTLINARVGQGLFRKALVEKYNSECIITHINNPKLLVASHIKPWAISDNSERVSVENGLLLSPTFDRLFDCGLISFRDNGRMLLSSFVGKENLPRLHLGKDLTYDLKASCSMLKNLEYHRDVIFVN